MFCHGPTGTESLEFKLHRACQCKPHRPRSSDSFRPGPGARAGRPGRTAPPPVPDLPVPGDGDGTPAPGVAICPGMKNAPPSPSPGVPDLSGIGDAPSESESPVPVPDLLKSGPGPLLKSGPGDHWQHQAVVPPRRASDWHEHSNGVKTWSEVGPGHCTPSHIILSGTVTAGSTFPSRRRPAT
jgi:hypothetical protein